MEKDLLDHDRPVEEIPGSPLSEETSPPWETPGREEKDLPPEDPLAAKRAELKEREERLAEKERKYRAQERLLSLRFSLDLLEHFDFSSDEAVDRMLALLERAAAEPRQTSWPGFPPASVPAVTMPKTYTDRARLYKGRPCFDCAQLVRFAMRAGNSTLPSGASSQWRCDRAWSLKAKLNPDYAGNNFCVLFRRDPLGSRYKPMAHVGLSLGDGYVIDARSSGRGDEVRELQTWMRDIGYPLKRYGIDGVYGLETATAVKEFQSRNGLLATGAADERTLWLIHRNYLDVHYLGMRGA